ncbi:MAG: hypothetical protein JWP91_3516 [Fibrobacteres bacterium]|nr:hypothetical protein [Fibrobacterota bacterium]
MSLVAAIAFPKAGAFVRDLSKKAWGRLASMACGIHRPGVGDPRKGVRGFTVIEITVALTVLSAGSAVLWYGLRSSARIDRQNRLHHAAVLAARSDLESLRGLPKTDIHDTAYRAPGIGEDSVMVVRRVMDSARIMNTLEEVVLDDKLSPRELHKPLEVRVKVYRIAAAGEGGGTGPSFSLDEKEDPFAADGSDKGKPRLLTSLTLKLPEYKWY